MWAFKNNRPAQIITAAIALLVLAGVIGLIVWQSRSTPSGPDVFDSQIINANRATVSDTAPRRIDGVAVPVNESNFLPLALVIENLVTVRPQAGLSQANLVYEVLAEGGITRFLAVYASNEAIKQIGPVRSARHYLVDLAEEYGGIFGHVGGSPQALGILGSDEFMTDLNQFSYAQYFYRDQNIEAPHNLFTTSELMTFALRDLGFIERVGEYEPYLFKQQLNKKDRPINVAPLTIDWSNDDYAVEWRYDQATNSYKRWNAGVEQMDANTNEQLSARNIVVQRVETTLLETDTGRLDIITLGEGEAVVFQDGTVLVGRWKKANRGDRTKFYINDTEEVSFNPGTTWIELVPTDTAVTY